MNDSRQTILADLHIHTPASRCFKDEKDESSYLGILKEAKKKDLSIIGITDHNSIDGYRNLVEIKEKIQEEANVLENIKDSEQANKKLKKLNKELAYFKDLLIIPGIEFEVNNGIHILCLFNPETPIQKIEEFLNNGGYYSDDYGFESAKKISKWDIFQFFEESKRYDCIIIDAHTDSDKGILETFKNGLPRAHCLSNSQLSGLCYKSEKQRSQLEKTMDISVEYQRDIPLAFLKSSDAHKVTDVGKDVTFFKLKELTFTELKNAFSNPLEYISTTFPVVKDIVDKIITTGKYLTVNSIDDNSINSYLCALNNATGGYILLGINELGGISGFSDEVFDDAYKYIIESIRSLSWRIDYDVNAYPIQQSKFILIINIKKGIRLVDLKEDNTIWVFENKKIKKLSADEIERIIERKVTAQLQHKIVKRLSKIEAESLEIKNTLFSFPIIQKFEQQSISIFSIISEPEFIEPLKLSVEQIASLKNYVKTKNNGKTKGNIFYFDDILSPRLNGAYLRCSIPKHYLKGIKNHTKKIEHIIIVPGGATFYATKRIEQYNDHGLGILKICSDDENYPIKFIASFLKSSFFLWYFNFKHDSVDIFDPDKIDKVLLPTIHIKNPNHKQIIDRIEVLFDSIIEKEYLFLQKDLKVEQDDYEEIIENHNQQIDDLAYEIDLLIFKLIELTPSEIKIIESSLVVNDIYIPQNE